MDIDLDMPLFSTSKVVEMVDHLNIDTLKNWDKRGLLAKDSTARSEKYAHVKRTIRDVIILQIMVDLAAYGFKPSLTASIASKVAESADAFVQSEHFRSRFGLSNQQGTPQYLFTSDAVNNYRRAVITVAGDEQFSVMLMETGDMYENFFRAHLPQNVGRSAYIVVEADFTFAMVINRAVVALGGAPKDGGR